MTRIEYIIGCATVPSIERIEKDFNLELDNKYQQVRMKLSGVLNSKFSLYKNPSYSFEKEQNKEQRRIFKDCIEQTIMFLHSIKALKPVKFEVKQIVLWRKFIDLEPFYEGVYLELQSMLVKTHYPTMYEQIMKGHVYSHIGLTHINECVSYVIEYLKKKDLLADVDEVVNNKEVKKWCDDYNAKVKKQNPKKKIKTAKEKELMSK